MALATANEVMTQVPWSGDTPRSPAIAGIDTLAIDVSSTFMNVASDSTMVPSTSAPPVSGAAAAFAATCVVGASGAVVVAMMNSVPLPQSILAWF